MPRCRICKATYTRTRERQTTCGRFECQVEYAEQAIQKRHSAIDRKRRKEELDERREIKSKLQLLEPIPKLKNRAQKAFNAYIRARDRDKGCFVCGKEFPVGRFGGDFDAGHVRSRGAADHLRFNEDNCHGECKECNCSWGAKPHEIEAGAIRRIGRERYEALKNDNSTHKWTREELLEIIEESKEKLRQIKKSGERGL